MDKGRNRLPRLALWASLAALWTGAWPAGGQVSRAERRLGPFEIGGKTFTVLLRLQRIAGAPDGFEETLESFSVVDEGNADHYRRDFKPEAAQGMFAETIGLDARLLENEENGRMQEAAGLILYYGCIPSAPSSGLSVQVLANDDGRLVPSSAPLTVYGRIHELEPGRRPGSRRLGPRGTIDFGVWTGWFEIIVPVKVLDRPRIVPRHRHLTYGLDAFAVAAERAPLEEETFVRLFRSPDDRAPAHLIIKKDSRVEFLQAYAQARLTAGESEVVVSVGEKPWLMVRIDGREGFVRDEEDLQALGLRPAG